MGLTHDPEYRATTFIVIDFEATTPKGYRPEPIEVAALAVRTLALASPRPERSLRSSSRPRTLPSRLATPRRTGCAPLTSATPGPPGQCSPT